MGFGVYNLGLRAHTHTHISIYTYFNTTNTPTRECYNKLFLLIILKHIPETHEIGCWSVGRSRAVLVDLAYPLGEAKKETRRIRQSLGFRGSAFMGASRPTTDSAVEERERDASQRCHDGFATSARSSTLTGRNAGEAVEKVVHVRPCQGHDSRMSSLSAHDAAVCARAGHSWLRKHSRGLRGHCPGGRDSIK